MRTKTPKSKTILTKIVAIVILALLVIAAVKCANGASLANTAWSLLPPVIAIVLALITKEAYSALFIGVLVGGLFTCGFAPVATLDTILNDGLIAAIAANAGIFLFLVLLGIIVSLVNAAGGSAAFGRWAETHIKTHAGAQLATFVLGILIFIDDYFNCLTVGSVMRPVTDGHKISRPKLAYLIDATAAPVCMIARELNYPVPAIIQKIDDNDAMILVADSNLHRPHISTYDLSRTLRNKMTAMKRKAGRKKRGVPGADELQSDAMLAKEMGISTSKLNRIIRLSEATKAVCDAVDDNSLELSIASDLSFLSPEHQNAVIDLVGLNLKPTVKRVQRLRDAEKRGNLDDKTMRAILEDKDIQPVKPPEPPKPAPTQPDPPFPVASMVTPNVSPAPAPATGTSPVTLAPPNMKPVMPEPPKQENTARPPATQTVEKPETAPTSVSNVIPISAESKQPGDSKAADDEPIEFNSPRENLYSLKITLGGDRLRRYFPDVTMPALAITESIYSALEERRQREARMKQKTEILHPSKPIPTR